MKNPLIINLLNNEESSKIKEKFSNELIKLKQFYSSNESMESFKKKYVNHESVLMKCLAYRMLDNDFWSLVKKKNYL